MKTEELSRIHFPAHYTRAPDGARIRYFDSEEDLPALVLANGLGGPVCAWNPYVERWRGRFRVLTWEYRGLYGSTLPARTAALDISTHAEDLKAVLDAAGVERAALFGWSMGVQVALEFSSKHANMVSNLVLANGTYGRPLRGVPLPFSGLTLPPLVRGVRRLPGFGRELLTKVSRFKLSYAFLRTTRIIAAGFERKRFEEMVAAFESVDLDIYFDLLERLHDHDAEHLLGEVKAPTLVVAGARDLLTPPWFARRMAELIEGSELFVVPAGTHYAPAEYPHVVAGRIEEFLKSSKTSAPERENG